MWWGGYIGIPFSDTECGVLSTNCWGLVRLIYRAELGIELPTYGEIPASELLRATRAMAEAAASSTWVQGDGMSAFDVVPMRRYGSKHIGHVGIATGDGRLVHIEKATDSVCVPFDHFTIKDRIIGFKRHRSLAHAA